MASVLREKRSRPDDARSLLRQIYGTEVDLIPDLDAKTSALSTIDPALLSKTDPGPARGRGR